MISAKTLDDLGWPILIDHWAKRCATSRGAAAVRAGLLLDAIDAARERTAEISEARVLRARDKALPLGGIADIAPAVERVRKAAALDAPELVAVASTGRSLSRLRAHLREHAEVAPKLAARAAGIADLGHVYHPILEAFDADGRLVDHASDELGPLRRAAASIKAQLEKRMEAALVDERFAPYLQDAYYTQREDRYVLPVRTDGKGFVRGIVHGTSQSGQTLFIEPEEIVDLNNRLKLAEAEVADEERRIYIKFSGWIAEEADAFVAALAVAETVDAVAAAAIMADDTVSAEPILDEAPRMGLLHARHPLMLLRERTGSEAGPLGSMTRGRRCVANDVTVAAGQSLLVSGPNAGGKTVALKTVGLAAVMARAGLHLCAESGSAIGWFTSVVTDIGDAQSLEKDLSTFSGHMVNLRELLAHAGPGMLVLIDEIAVGTDPEQGAALAQSVLEELAAKGVTALVTTHYERLKALGAQDSRFANASVGFDLERLEPTFKLHMGTPGSSGALAVARRMGIAVPIVERARELLGGGGARIEDLLSSVADQRRRLEDERAALLAELEAVEAERAGMRATRDKTRARYEKQTAREHGEAVSALRAARREIDDLRKELRAKAAAATPDDVRAATRKLVAPGAAVAQHEPRRKLPPGSPATAEQLVPGTPVIVPKLGRCEVATAPTNGKVEVRLGGMRAMVSIADVLLDSHRAARRAEQERAAAEPRSDDKPQGPSVVLVDGVPAGGRATARTIDSTIDIRGQRVDEAVANVDRFLDESLLASRDTAFIVHGHGTGALRQAVRSHLAAHGAIETFRAGEPSEGGDGVTVAFLKG
jgi:DNA mismatch repair protein MutS2